MEALGPIAFFSFIALVVVGGLVGTYYYEKKRSEALADWGREHAFVPDANTHGFEQQMGAFKLFNKGHSRKVMNLMRSTREGMHLALCDYRYTTGGGKSSHTWNQTVCAIATQQAMPLFRIRPQLPLFDALGKLFGGQDVNFDEAPDFSKAYVLQTDGDEGELRRWFHAGVRDAFVRLAAKHVQAEAVGGTLLVHYGQKRLSVEQLEGLVADAVNLRRALMR